VLSQHNPGFSAEMFLESLSYLHRIPDREFAAYGASEDRIGAMRREFHDWESELRAET
jgi:hypothetical protein